MRTDYKFLNLCGAVYNQGNLIFTGSGKELLSPVGNRVARYDLVRSVNKASSFECLKDVRCMDLSEGEGLMVVVDADGRGVFVNWEAEVALEVVNFKPGVTMVKISHNERYLAVVTGREVQIWSTPPNKVLQYRSVHLLKRIAVTSSDVTSLKWSSCDRYLLLGSDDCTVRLVPLQTPSLHAQKKADSTYLGMKPHVTLSAHRCPIINVFFANSSNTLIYSASSDRTVAVWQMTDRDRYQQHLDHNGKPPKVEENEQEEEEEEEQQEHEEGEEGSDAPPTTTELTLKNWKIKKRFFLEHDARLQTIEYHNKSGLLFAGFKNGVFGIYTTKPDVRCVHTLSITEQKISSVAVNKTGDWVAFGSEKLGQLLVWEWQSETYVLKQQSHYHDVSTVAFSPDGAVVATSSDDGKVKIWNGSTGFCFSTFRDHQGPVSEVRFANNHTLWSASADGTVRGYDLKKYKQFRVLQPPVSAQISCFAIDPSGELIAGGSLTEPDVYLWSSQTSQVLEVFSGHEGPISGIDFHQSGTVLATSSWDKTVRIWGVYSSSTSKVATGGMTSTEAITFNSEVITLRFSPDGLKLCVLTLNGDMALYNTEDTNDITPLRTVSVHRDVKGGWRSAEATNPFKGQSARHFDTISWSPDSQGILLAGNSKWIALYGAEQSHLLQKWEVTNNRSLDGMSDVYDYRAVTEAGNIHNLDLADDDSEDDIRKVTKLPGAQRGDQGKRKKTRPVARSKCVQFSPTGKEWAAATTDGLLLYSTEVDAKRFNPTFLAMGLTPMGVYGELEKGNYVVALLKALRLNDNDVCTRVLHGIPAQEIPFVADNVPAELLVSVLELLCRELGENRNVERVMRWACHMLSRNGVYLQKHASATASGAPADGQLQATLKLLHQHVVKKTADLARLSEQNKHTLAFLDVAGGLEWNVNEGKRKEAEAEEEEVRQLGHKVRAKDAGGYEDGVAVEADEASSEASNDAVAELPEVEAAADVEEDSQEEDLEEAQPKKVVKKVKKGIKRKAVPAERVPSGKKKKIVRKRK
eukprot:TRINITY_DN869_c0_g1_i1.p1 TRINITY_DN869_c0_g1~~TRINITY_DN869_c0_g1_i1.p1  ORF type:complete len:1032 (+),score=393.40 TRINITY_DN869_c0_g1_i1:298-3393(+)